MQFTVTAAAFLALIGSAMAQIAGFDAISAPADGEVITADGKTATTITWDPSADYNGQMVSILLLQGATEATLDFYPGDNVACEFHLWLPVPPSSLPDSRRRNMVREQLRSIVADQTQRASTAPWAHMNGPRRPASQASQPTG